MGDAYIDLDNSGFYFDKWKCQNPSNSVNLIDEFIEEEFTINTVESEEDQDEEIEEIDISTFNTTNKQQDEHTLINGQRLKICEDRSPKFKTLVTKLFNAHTDTLIDDEKRDIGVNKKYVAKIKHTTKPPNCYKYMASKPLHRKIMEEKIAKLIIQGVVEYTNEPANSQTFLVEKHNSHPIDDQRHYRVVNDLRSYNQTVCPHVLYLIFVSRNSMKGN